MADTSKPPLQLDFLSNKFQLKHAEIIKWVVKLQPKKCPHILPGNYLLAK